MSFPRSLLVILLSVTMFAACWTADAQVPLATQAAPPAEEPAPIEPELARALIEALEDAEARAALIVYLRSAVDEAPAAEGAAAAPAETTSFPQQIGAYTKQAAETTSALVLQITRSLYGLSTVATGQSPVDWDAVGMTLIRVGFVALVAFGTFYVLRFFTHRLFAAFEQRARNSGAIGRLVLLVIGGLIDLAGILVAWGVGYAFALFSGTELGQMRVQTAYFLNAFLVVEATKVALRFLLAPRYAGLRLLPVNDLAANYWHFWLARLAGFLGYGILFFVPLAITLGSVFLGRGLRMLILLTTALIAIVIILQNKRPVGAAIRQYGAGLPGISSQRLFHLMGGLWHLVAILYVMAMFVVSVTRPGRALEFMLGSTLQTFLVIAAAAVVMAVIRRTITGGMRLPQDVRLRLPLLERQLNQYVPTILKIVRIVLLIAVTLAIIEVWEIVDVVEWLTSDTGSVFVAGLLGAALTALIALALWLGVSSWIDFRLNPAYGTVPTARERTLLALFRNAALITIVVLGLMLGLSQIGLNIGPLLAGAGVVGLAIGFGAQKLVQDIITGLFIQFENAINEGDVVTVGGITGVAERLTVRSVGLRSIDGTYHIVPFSSVDSVSNFMRGFSYHLADIGVAYRENIKEVKRLLGVAYDRLKGTEHAEVIIDPLEVFGVNELADSAVIVRVRIKTLPGSQWAVGRAYNEAVKEVFDEAGVEIPFPHLTVYMGRDKDGGAPPLRVRRDGEWPGPAEQDSAKALTADGARS